MTRPYFLLLLLLVAGCTATRYNVGYRYALKSVEPSAGAATLAIARQDTATESRFVFNDKRIEAAFMVDSSRIVVAIRNKTEFPIIIPWERATLVDSRNVSRGIVPERTGESARDQRVKPSMIAGESMVMENLRPTTESSLDPTLASATQGADDKSSTALLAAAQKQIGKTLVLSFPLIIQAVALEYKFHFEVDSLELHSIGAVTGQR